MKKYLKRLYYRSLLRRLSVIYEVEPNAINDYTEGAKFENSIQQEILRVVEKLKTLEP